MQREELKTKWREYADDKGLDMTPIKNHSGNIRDPLYVSEATEAAYVAFEAGHRLPEGYDFDTGDINGIVSSCLEGMKTSGIIAKTIRDKVESETIKKIEEMFRWQSDFSKGLEKHLSGSLKVNFNEIVGIDGYHQQILNMIQKVVDNQLAGDAQKRVAETIEKILENPPEKIVMADAIKQFLEDGAEKASEEGWDEMTYIVKDANDRYFSYISFDPEPNKTEYSCRYRLGIHKDRGHGFDSVFTLSVNGQDAGKELFAGPVYGIERLLYQAFVAKLPIDFAEMPYLEYPEWEDEDGCHC